MEVIFIEPICKEYIWGGTKLQEEYNKKNKFFDVKKIVVKEKFESHSNINTLLMMNVIEENGKLYDSKKEYILNKWDTFIIPVTMGKYKIMGNLEIIRTSLVKEKNKK